MTTVTTICFGSHRCFLTPLHLGKSLFLVLAFFQAPWVFSTPSPELLVFDDHFFDAGCEEANQRRCAAFIDKLGIVRKTGHNLSFVLGHF